MQDDYGIEYDFGQEREQREADFVTVPAGTYLCRVDEARPGETRSGHTRWGLKFVVQEGPEAGRVAAWDGLTFSPNAAARTQQVLAALGLPHEGRVKLTPGDLVGRLAFVRVEQGTYRSPSTGLVSNRMRVPYDGVQPADGASGERQGVAEEAGAHGEIPF